MYTTTALQMRHPATFPAVLHAGLKLAALWRGRARSRQALAQMSDRLLADIGISRADARKEAGKWFWQA